MDEGIVNPGFSGNELTQGFSSVPTTPRETPVHRQRTHPVSSEPRKSEAPTEASQQKPSKDLVQEVAFANAIAEFLNQKVSFSYDKRINQIVVKVTKGTTEEVIRQIPSEEMIDLIMKFRKDFRGLIFNKTG